MQASVTFSNSSLQAGALSSSFQVALRIFPIFQLEFLTPAFMLPCIAGLKIIFFLLSDMMYIMGVFHARHMSFMSDIFTLTLAKL